MPDLQGLNAETIRKPYTISEKYQGLKSRLFKDSVMEPGWFIMNQTIKLITDLISRKQILTIENTNDKIKRITL